MVPNRVKTAYRAIENVTEGCDIARFRMHPAKIELKENRLGHQGASCPEANVRVIAETIAKGYRCYPSVAS